jgi:signal transduction histidine kinase
MADRSAAVLFDVVLADDADSAKRLESRLAADPSLLLWTVCRAADCEAFQPRSIRHAAEWLRHNLLDALQSRQTKAGTSKEDSLLPAQRYADRVAAVLQIGELAALLAAPAGEAAAEEAFMRGLLHDPGRWFHLDHDGKPPSDPECLPKWLLAESAVASRVAEAAEILVGQREAAPPDFDRDDCAARAKDTRREWLENLGPSVDRLPVLVDKLARLAALESRFEDLLETEKLEAMAEFAAGAGHEINNPLAIVGGRAQLLLREERDPERRRELAVVNAQIKRAHEMIADLRLFSRPPRPEPERIELVALVDELIADTTPQAAERAVALSRTGDDGPLELEADPAQLRVALRALCRNALEAIGHDGRVEIALRQRAGQVEIRVSDNGAGIRPEHRRHIFDPFYSARQAGRGLGFGLSKCWRIVTGHGGRIDVESEPGQGAVFTVTLPRRWSG